MKRLLIIMACLLFGFAACAQPKDVKGNQVMEVRIPSHKLVATQNMWIFLKLDTRKGLVKMLQYSLDEKNRLEVPINYLPLASGADAIPGRFNLYPTQNMWNFILLDEVDGRSWQVQWSTDGKEGIIPINTSPSE